MEESGEVVFQMRFSCWKALYIEETMKAENGQSQAFDEFDTFSSSDRAMEALNPS